MTSKAREPFVRSARVRQTPSTATESPTIGSSELSTTSRPRSNDATFAR
jgi:hypothetical protein